MRPLPDISTKNVRRDILEYWETIYTDLKNRMLVDQGRFFGKREDSRLFEQHSSISNVVVDKNSIEAHYSLGLGERYHQPIRQTYQHIMSQHSND